MSNLLQEALGAPRIEPILRVVQGEEISSPQVEVPHDVKRIRFGMHSGRLLLGLNAPAARDLMTTPAFWYHMDAVGQIPIFLRPDELIEGYHSAKQAILVPKKDTSGERGPNLSEQQMAEFARMCVEGKIVRRWAVPESEAAHSGVIVCDNRQALPENPTDTGPLNCDVIAASLAHYEPR